MTSSQYGSYIQGCTRATMAGTEGSQTARLSRSRKPVPVRIGCLQLDSMKPESLVKAYQLRRLEYVPGQNSGAYRDICCAEEDGVRVNRT